MKTLHAVEKNQKSYVKFIVVWAGQLLSGLGNGMTAFALGVYVFRQTSSAFAFSMVSLCLFVPSILLKPLGGVLADRYDRRFLIIAGDTGSALSVLFLMTAAFGGSPAFWKIYLGVSLNSIFTALQNPAYKAAVTDMINPAQFSKAGGLVQLAGSAQHLLSPVAAGFILSTGSLTTVLLIDLSTFLIAVAAVLSMHTSGPRRTGDTERSFIQDLQEGWKTVIADRAILQLVLLISLVTFFVGFLQTLLAPMLLPLTDPKTLGSAQSMSACGMLISSLILGVLGLRGSHSTSLILSLVLAGLCMALMGVSTSILFITAVLFAFFCTLPVINTSADVMIRTHIPNEQQGRAWGMIGLLSQIGYIGAYSISGALADRVFNPLLSKTGPLAASVGQLTGTGPGRGIALMLLIAGTLMVIASTLSINRLRRLKSRTKGVITL